MKRTLAAAAVVAAAVAAVAAQAAPPQSVTLAANPTVVVYGKTTTLTGQITPAAADTKITIQGQACGSTAYKNVTTTKTVANGTYTVTVTPTTQTNYKAVAKPVESPAALVRVRPAVVLTRLAARSFSVSVTAAQSFVGKSVVFQRYSKLRRKWIRVKNVTLTTSAPGTPHPAVNTTAKFSSRVRARTRVRILMPLAQTQPCYLSAKSNVIRA